MHICHIFLPDINLAGGEEGKCPNLKYHFVGVVFMTSSSRKFSDQSHDLIKKSWISVALLIQVLQVNEVSQVVFVIRRDLQRRRDQEDELVWPGCLRLWGWPPGWRYKPLSRPKLNFCVTCVTGKLSFGNVREWRRQLWRLLNWGRRVRRRQLWVQPGHQLPSIHDPRL